MCDPICSVNENIPWGKYLIAFLSSVWNLFICGFEAFLKMLFRNGNGCGHWPGSWMDSFVVVALLIFVILQRGLKVSELGYVEKGKFSLKWYFATFWELCKEESKFGKSRSHRFQIICFTNESLLEIRAMRKSNNF